MTTMTVRLDFYSRLLTPARNVVLELSVFAFSPHANYKTHSSFEQEKSSLSIQKVTKSLRRSSCIIANCVADTTEML